MENVFEHDAIPTWSGFIYQGRIAAYLAIKKIIELRDDNKVSEVDKYAIEMEKCEDIAIVYQCEKEKREYISIHQVKNEKENALGAYKKPLIQLMLEKGYYTKDNGDAPDAYLHIANRVRIQNKDFETKYLENIKNWKQKILNYYNAVDEACKNFTYNPHFYEELLKAIDTEPIGIDRSEYKKRYNAAITYCKKVMENNDSKDILKLKEELENLKDYLLNKFAVPNISNEVTIYEYDTGLKYFDATKIFDEIVGLVEKYKGTVEGWSKEQYKYLADKILNYIDKTILERHKKLQENNGVVKEISLRTIKDIMDSVIENNEKEANVLALKRGYIETLEKFCEKCKRSNDYTCQDIGCKLQQAEYRKENLNEEDFVKFCYNLRPECEKKIEDRACIADLGNKDGLIESVFPIIKEIPSERFMSKEDERQLKVRNYDKTAFITAITNSDAEDTVLGIEQAMDKNSVMIESIFDADQLVTTRLEAEENIWNQSCIKIRSDEIGDGQNVENRDEKSIYVPKRPEFVKAVLITERKISIHTTATDKNGKKEIEAGKDLTIVDTVTLEGLEIGTNYKLSGWQMIKEENAKLIIDGKEVTNDYEFTADKENMEVQIEFTFDGSTLGGKQLVTFEELYDMTNPEEPKKVTEHKDINDEGQTVTIKEVPETPTPETPGTTTKTSNPPKPVTLRKQETLQMQFYG